MPIEYLTDGLVPKYNVDIAEACGKIIAGRRFDNGLICLGEQTAFVPEEKFDEFIAEFRKQGGYYAEGKEATDKLREGIFQVAAQSTVML